MRDQQLPAYEIVEGILIAIAGALLLTPGFVTDSFGFLLLFSILRRTIAKKLVNRLGFENFVQSTNLDVNREKKSKGETLEGDFERR